MKEIDRQEIHDILSWPNLKEFFKRHKNKHLILEIKKESPKIINLRWRFKK